MAVFDLNIPAYMTALAKEPLKTFRFLVEVDGETVCAFSQFSGVKMEMQTIQVRAGSDNRGVQDYIPVLTRYEPVTLTKGVFGHSEFINWIFSAGASMYTGPTGVNLRKTINVIALDDLGTYGVVWTLKDAMPIGYELSPMDGARSEVLTESVTFAITGMSRTVGGVRLLLQALGGG